MSEAPPEMKGRGGLMEGRGLSLEAPTEKRQRGSDA